MITTCPKPTPAPPNTNTHPTVTRNATRPIQLICCPSFGRLSAGSSACPPGSQGGKRSQRHSVRIRPTPNSPQASSSGRGKARESTKGSTRLAKRVQRLPAARFDSKSLPVRQLSNRDRPDSESHQEGSVAPLTKRRRIPIWQGQYMHASLVLPRRHSNCGKARGREGDLDRFRAPFPTDAGQPRRVPS